MFVRRLTASFKEQHWMTIVIELVIVIIGVFVGNQVSNWNEARIEKRQTQQVLEQLRPELKSQLSAFKTIKAYYATTRRFADLALAGWSRDPQVGDNQFVIAAYQASQIYGIGMNADAWSLAFGSDQLRQIEDSDLRRALTVVLTANYGPVEFNAMATPYREHVRQLIPTAVQDQIRSVCGDRNVQLPGQAFIVVLPAKCPLQLDPTVAARTAAILRAHPELAGELNWHIASLASYLLNLDGIESGVRALQHVLDKRR